jgi:hypothetical protein
MHNVSSSFYYVGLGPDTLPDDDDIFDRVDDNVSMRAIADAKRKKSPSHPPWCRKNGLVY